MITMETGHYSKGTIGRSIYDMALQGIGLMFLSYMAFHGLVGSRHGDENPGSACELLLYDNSSRHKRKIVLLRGVVLHQRDCSFSFRLSSNLDILLV